jgi:hypothetical protein
MILEKKEYGTEAQGTYIECIYDSTNVLKTTYFPMLKRLYISFNKGNVYSYSNINEDLYKEFENSDSQGKFFASNIRNKPDEYMVRKEFTLYPSEVEETKVLIKEYKSKKDNSILNE